MVDRENTTPRIITELFPINRSSANRGLQILDDSVRLRNVEPLARVRDEMRDFNPAIWEILSFSPNETPNDSIITQNRTLGYTLMYSVLNESAKSRGGILPVIDEEFIDSIFVAEIINSMSGTNRPELGSKRARQAAASEVSRIFQSIDDIFIRREHALKDAFVARAERGLIPVFEPVKFRAITTGMAEIYTIFDQYRINQSIGNLIR